MQAATCPPVIQTRWGLNTVSSNAEHQAAAVNTNFESHLLNWTGNRTKALFQRQKLSSI